MRVVCVCAHESPSCACTHILSLAVSFFLANHSREEKVRTKERKKERERESVCAYVECVAGDPDRERVLCVRERASACKKERECV